MATLEIRDLHVSVEESVGVHREILRGVNLTVREGETHAIMGPNGSGKSTLAYAIAGHPKYLVTRGSVTLDGEDVLAMSVDTRARSGLFLAMQYPIEVPGVSVSNFLRTAVTAVRRKFDTDTPGTSTGYCMARNRPARARESTLMASTSSPSSVTLPRVTRYLGWPAIA